MKHLTTYKIFESYPGEINTIRDNVFDILLDITDNGWNVSCECPVVSSRDYPERIKCLYPIMNISIWIPKGVRFRVVKQSVEHLISYMKSVGYSRFIYKDNMLNFNQPNGWDGKKQPQKENYRPTDDNDIEYGLFEFIKDK